MSRSNGLSHAVPPVLANPHTLSSTTQSRNGMTDDDVLEVCIGSGSEFSGWVFDRSDVFVEIDEETVCFALSGDVGARS